MYPYFEIFSFKIPTYGLIAVVGVLAAFLVGYIIAKKKGCADIEMVEIAAVAGVGVFIGAHLLFAITRIDAYIEVFRNYDRFENFFEFIKCLFELASGMVFYGGLLGGLLFGYLYARIKKYPHKDYTDIFAVLIPLFHAFGRIGCFFAGCCYGVEWEYGISGRVLVSGAHEDVKRLPIQIIESACLLILFIVLLLLFNKGIAKGRLLFVYLLSYSVLRFTLEFWRGDEIRGRLLGLSTSQWISVLIAVGVAVFLIVGNMRKKKSTE